MKKTKVALFLSTCLFSQAYAKDITLMVLGPTGVGKSTLMNAIYMHATQATFDPANAKFIIELDSGSQEPTPPRLNGVLNPERFTGAQVAGQTPYENFKGQIRNAEDSVAPSQTSRLTFTPQLRGWSPDDRLQLLDTPGLDNIASYNNQSAHILIAQAIETHLKQYPNQLTAIALVLPASLTREDPHAKQLLNTIRIFFLPQVLERLYIFINGTQTHTQVDNSIKDNDSKEENPTYIAPFNHFLASENADTLHRYQADIDLTQGTIQALLDEVRQFEQPISIKAYAGFTTPKNELAQHLRDAIKIRFQIEEKTKEQKALQEQLDSHTTTCNTLEANQKRLESVPKESISRKVVIHSFFGGVVAIQREFYSPQSSRKADNKRILTQLKQGKNKLIRIQKALYELENTIQHMDEDYLNHIEAMHVLLKDMYG